MLERGTSMQMQYEDILLSSGDLCLKAQFFGVTMDVADGNNLGILM